MSPVENFDIYNYISVCPFVPPSLHPSIYIKDQYRNRDNAENTKIFLTFELTSSSFLTRKKNVLQKAEQDNLSQELDDFIALERKRYNKHLRVYGTVLGP